MSDQTPGPNSDADADRAKLTARAVMVADRIQQSIGTLATLDREVLTSVFGLEPEQVRGAHVFAIVGEQSAEADLTSAVNRCFASLIRTAAAFRKRSADSSADPSRTMVLLDDLQILHRELDVLQKFLLAPDLLSQLARAAYVRKYMAVETASPRPPAAASGAVDGPSQAASAPAAPATSAAQPSPQQIAPAAATPGEAVSTAVTCPHCGQQFAAAAYLAGKQVRCTNCGQPFTVPSAASRKATPADASPAGPKAASASASAPMVAADVFPAAASSADKIPVSCPHCRRHFLAQPALAGLSVACPSCGATLTVPEAAPAELGPEDTYRLDAEYLAELGGEADYAAQTGPGYGSLAGDRYYLQAMDRRGTDDEIPRWIWNAMAVAFAVCLLMILAIAITSFVRSRRSGPSSPQPLSPPASTAPADNPADPSASPPPALSAGERFADEGGEVPPD